MREELVYFVQRLCDLHLVVTQPAHSSGGMELVVRTVGSAATFVADLLYSFTDIFLTQPLGATLRFLEETELKTLDGGQCTG